MLDKPLRLIPYVRVSKVAGRAGDSFQSPDQQLEAIGHAVGLRPGAKLLSEVRDLDESGGTMDRPGLKEALALIESGSADGIVVAKLDRFARDPAAIMLIESLERRGKVFISAADNFDTTTWAGRFALGMMILVAKMERDRHIETWAVSTRRAVNRGVHTRVPFGYCRSNGNGSPLAVEPAEAEVVVRIFRSMGQGIGAAATADALNADGLSPRRAACWTRQSVRALVRSRTYLGEARYGENFMADAHEALVSEAEWEAAQVRTRRSPVHANRGASLLAGLVRCAGCGYVMGAGSNGRGMRRYNCNRHHGSGECPAPTTANAEAVEELVAELFLTRYGTTTVTGATDNPEVTFSKLEWDRLQREFVAWRDDTMLRAALGDDEYRAGLVSRKEAMDDARWAHEEAVRNAAAGELAVDVAVWAELSMPERRELLRAGIDMVVLGRASSTRSPLAERLDIRWIGEAAESPTRQGALGRLVALSGNP